MRLKLPLYLLLCLPLLFTANTFAQQTAAQAWNLNAAKLPSTKWFFNPDTPSIWHQLGVPQARGRWQRWRDTRVNRDGLSPGKEQKMPLLKIADPKFLEPGAPELLKAAAEIKVDQDLAPQKIKALRYLCSVGCSCYNKKGAGLVEKAVLEGLEDCVDDVRLAAIQLVIANAGNQCSVGGQCETCCSEGLLKKLNELAYKMNDKGCYLEPNARVRALAEQALTACPPLPEKTPEEILEEERIRLEGGKKADDADGADKPTEDTSPETARSSRRQANPYYQVASQSSTGDAWTDPALAELQVRGVIESRDTQSSTALIVFDQQYKFPIGTQIVIAIDEYNVSFGSIISSDAGKSLIHIDDSRLFNVAANAARIRLGILE